MTRVPFDELYAELRRVLLKLGFREDRAARCARLFAETDLDGVYSHGLNRFPRFLHMIRAGFVDIHAEPEPAERAGVVERWDGRRGVGNLNAQAAMARAVALARAHGAGCVALRNTNHWMRGGSYGLQAAGQGAVGACWTNTMRNMPPWGGREARLGNNPLILAVPGPEGPVLLDVAMSQFSYGRLATYSRRGEPLPVDGGYDEAGRLTRDAAAIEASQRPLPIGYWKGSGLALLLDLTAALLSGGLATHQIAPDALRETSLSQLFLALDLTRFYAPGEAERVVGDALRAMRDSEPAEPGGEVTYPGERTLRTRRENQALGIPVDPRTWAEVRAL